MKPELKEISHHRYTWSNATRNVEVTPLRFFYPRHKEDIAHIIQDAEDENKRGNSFRVRAVGSGHSFSEAAKGKDYLMSMKRLDKVWKTSKKPLQDDWKSKDLVTAEAGIIIKKLNIELDKMDLALSNMGAVDLQTISGALMTGTHGTGIKKPAFQDMVRSMRMVGTRGEFLQIEPKNGMTNAQKHAQEYPNVRLIQSDDVFYSTVVSFGGMGIVYEITIEVEKAFWMEEKRVLKSWEEVREELENGCFMKKVQKIPFVAFRVNPFEFKEEHRCAVVEQVIKPKSKRPKGIPSMVRNLISTIGGSFAYLIELTIRQLSTNPERAKKTIHNALGFTKDKSYFDKSYKVLYQSGGGVIRYGISSEFAFDAKAETIVKVITKIFEQAIKNEKDGELYQSAHVPVRFTPPSKAYLSSSYGRETVYIDVPLLYGTTGDIEILERYQDMMMDLGGIPHWGKCNRKLYQRKDFIQQKFEKAKVWMCVRHQMDPKGTFLNDFIIQMGLGEKPADLDENCNENEK